MGPLVESAFLNDFITVVFEPAPTAFVPITFE